MHQVLVIGVGSIGERHLRCFQSTGRATMSFVEVNPDLRARTSECYRVPGFADLEQALENRPTIAVVATPAHLHVSMAAQLAEAGVHVLIEKPLSINELGIEHLQQTVASRNVIVAVAYVYRCHPMLTELRQALASGRFGKPVELIVVCGQHFPTYRPAYRTIYYADRNLGGGAIQDALTHVVNLGEWLIGPVTRIVADAAHQVLPDVEVEDTVHLLARHGQVLASYSLNQHQAPNEFTLSVICERGTVRCELHKNRWRWLMEPDHPWQDTIHPAMPRDAIFVAQANQFLDVIEQKSQPLCTLDEGIQTLRVNLAALASVDDRKWHAVAEGS